jgi:hypothetical protein
MNGADETAAATSVTRLISLLDDQIASAENGQFDRVEALLGQSSALADELVESGTVHCQAWQARQGDISQRYRRLELILASAREITKDRLKHTKTTTKMLAAYRSFGR